jgi:hypothetical protein
MDPTREAGTPAGVRFVCGSIPPGPVRPRRTGRSRARSHQDCPPRQSRPLRHRWFHRRGSRSCRTSAFPGGGFGRGGWASAGEGEVTPDSGSLTTEITENTEKNRDQLEAISESLSALRSPCLQPAHRADDEETPFLQKVAKGAKNAKPVARPWHPLFSLLPPVQNPIAFVIFVLFVVDSLSSAHRGITSRRMKRLPVSPTGCVSR